MKKGLLLVFIVFFSCRSDERLERIDNLWKWFADNKNEFQYKSFEEYNLSDSLYQRTKFIDPDITITFVKDSLGKTYKMIISAEGLEKCFENVQLIASRAPHFNDFKVIEFTPRNTSTRIDIQYSNVSISSEDVFFSYKNIENSKKINVDLFVKNYKKSNALEGVVYELLMHIVGEWDAVKSINDLKFHNINDTLNYKVHRITRLAKIIDENK